MNVLFLGYGKMGSSIGEAWLSSGLVSSIHAVDPTPDKNCQAVMFEKTSDLPDHKYDLIIVAVKPAYVSSVLDLLSDDFYRGSFVVSVAAGIKFDTLRESVRNLCPVVRAMPNTPVSVNAGCTVLYADERFPSELHKLITGLFSVMGTSNWVEDEAMMDAVTALSGSGPAYYHLFTEALAQAGVKLGLPPELATSIAIQTAYGATCLQKQPCADLVALRETVTSPNGTTAAAVNIFETDNALRTLVLNAAISAHDRSKELAE